jgi:hypothetical protein
MLEQETPIKDWLIEYVGKNKSPEDDEVTTEMIIEYMAKEFPEFLMIVAEENWVRGYKQALVDIDIGRQAEDNENTQTI